jgi:hypothetical protein
MMIASEIPGKEIGNSIGSGIMIDSKEASAALSDIDEMVRRVRQSHIYDLASQFMMVAGLFVVAGNLATFAVPRYGDVIWPIVNVITVAISAVISIFDHRRTGVRSLDLRVFVAFVIFYAFGAFCSGVLGHYGPRELSTFWPIYFMLFYSIAGLWFGRAFIAIGLGVTALTLIGYFFIGGATFLLWMAAVNGGGLVLSGLWMLWGE